MSPHASGTVVIEPPEASPAKRTFWDWLGDLLLRLPFVPGKVRTMVENGHLPRLGKYVAGSGVSAVVSTGTFLIFFATNALGSRGASLVASGAGAIVSYWLNRRWAWERKERADVRRELVPYWTTIVVTSIAVALLTGGANTLARHATDSHLIRAVSNAVAYNLSYALSFVVKYWIFDKVFRTKHHSAGDDDATDRAEIVLLHHETRG